MNDKNYQIVESLGVILLMTLFTILGIHIFTLILLIFPMVFIVYGVKNNIVASLLNIAIVSLIIGYMVDIYSGLALFIAFAPIVMYITYGIKNRKRSMEIIGVSALIFFIILLLISGIIRETSGLSIVNQMEEGFKSILDMQVELLQEMGQSIDEISNIKEFFESSYKYILLILPTLLILIAIFISYVNYYLASVTLRKIGIGIVNIPRFSRFRLPNNISLGVIVTFISLFILRYLNFPSYDAVLVNLVVLFSMMFLIQGLSVIDFFLLRFKMFFLFRLILVTTIVFITPLVSIISILGLIDTLFDFRKIRKKRS